MAVLTWLSPLEDTEILVVEQGAKPRLVAEELPACARHVFVHNPFAFNKSWGFNVGARRAEGEVLALADGDVVVDPATIQAGLRACRHELEALNPYAVLFDLDENQTGEFHAAGTLPPATPHSRRNRDYKGEYLCFCGGLYMIRRASYMLLGGQDERFKGWGGEDDAMSTKIALLDRTAVNRAGVAYHLFHPSAMRDSAADPNYRENLSVLREYAASSREQLRSRCDLDRAVMGDPGKYYCS
jgi:GT2 family glycosyltransferase